MEAMGPGSPSTGNPLVGLVGLITFFIILLFLRPTWKREGRLKRWHYVILFVIPIVIMLGSGLALSILGKPTLTAFINMMPAYKEVKNSQSGEVYLLGKVIIIDKYIDRLHDLYYKLPDEIKAKTPEEVSTVVIVNCTGTVKFYEVFGTSRKPVYDSSSCDADIIDWKIPAILSTYQNSQLGASPGMMANDLMKYLLSLPRKED